MITKISGECQMEGCSQRATEIACGRDCDGAGHPIPACYCETHAKQVAHEYHPEYTESCPNCGCRFGIN